MTLLHPQQKKIVKSSTRFKVIRAGRRAGKSVLQVERMIFDAVSKKDRNVFYIAPTQVQARDIIWLLLRKRLNGIAQFNEQRLEVLVPTTDGGKSLIKLAGWENRENFRGKSAYSLTFDETDTMRDLFVGWHDIFRPTLVDTAGTATFIGTPRKENPNLRRLEKIAETDEEYECFHFNTFDNPYLPETERDELVKEYKDNQLSYKQEILAEHVDDSGALFNYTALLDVFHNTAEDGEKYLIVDVSDMGEDLTVFSYWEGLNEIWQKEFRDLNTEGIILQTREYAHRNNIPFKNIAVDAIGVGAGVASNSQLSGIVGFKSSFAPIKTDEDIVRLPNAGYIPKAKILTSDYKNLRSQCVFTLSEHVNNHKIGSRVQGLIKDKLVEELATYQDVSPGDGKRVATKKENIKDLIGRSPDHSDTWIMRMYFELKKKVVSEDPETDNIIKSQFTHIVNDNR